jgi:hypothetical protein
MEISGQPALMAGVTATIDLGAAQHPQRAIASEGRDRRFADARERSVDRRLRTGATGAMQVGFGGLNISTPQQAAQ